MNRRKLFAIVACLAALTVTACTTEVEVGGEGGSLGTKVALKIPLTRGAGDEDAIATARVIIFTVEGGEEIFYRNKLLPDPGEMYTTDVPVGKLSVYLIANELSSWNLGDIDGSSTPADIKKKVLGFSAYPVIDASHPVPMYGAFERIQIDRYGATTLNGHPIDLNNTDGTVQRLYSKVTLSINCKYDDLPDQTPISLSGVAIKSLPCESYLSPASYSGAMFDGATVAAVSGVNYTQDAEGFSAAYDFYVPEHVVSDPAKGSYILISAYMTNRPSTKMTYKLMLGDAMAKGPDYMMRTGVTREDLTISRNTHYTVTIKQIKGFGDIDAMDVYAEAAPWEPVDIDMNIEGRRLNVSHLALEASELSSNRLHFWSDHTVELERNARLRVTVHENGAWQPGSTTDMGTVDLNDYFENITGSNFHSTWNNLTKTASGYVDIKAKSFTPGKYEFTAWLNAGGLRRQIKITLSMPFAMEDFPVVGTFHRKNQTGERIIYGWHPAGKVWTASVVTGADFIKLSTTPSADPGLWTGTPGNAENYPVTDGSYSVYGFGNILFRIGMSSTTTDNRYGLVRIKGVKRDGTELVVDIYVRQGEDADKVNGSAQWQPYNVDAAYGLTDYPTKAGKFFQWGRTVPYNVYGTLGAPWNSVPINDPDSFVDVCPNGYRYPLFDHYTEYGETSEINATTHIKGSYADGYYDRYSNYNMGAGINMGTPNVAYSGILAYNPGNYKAIFLPFAGNTKEDGTNLSYACNLYYWTKGYFYTNENTFYSVVFSLSANQSVPTYPGLGEGAAAAACNIRCVRIMGS